MRSSYIAALLAFLLAHLISLSIFFTTDSPVIRRRIWGLSYAFLAVVPPYLYFLFREVFGIVLPPEFVLFYVLFSLTVFLAILRVNAMEFNLHIRRPVLYSIGGAIFLMTVAFDFVFVPSVFRQYGFSNRFLLPVISLLVLLKIGWLFWAAHRRWVDRLFFHSSYKFRDLLRETEEEILRSTKDDQILTILVRHVCELIGRD